MNKHFTFDDRGQIYQGLLDGLSFRKIAQLIHKHPTTVSNEIKKFRQFKQIGAVGRSYNLCLHRKVCKRKDICTAQGCQKRVCTRSCQVCYLYCKNFIQEQCPQLSQPPYVCVGCKSRHKCTLEKAFYSPNQAHQLANQQWSQARQGLNFTEQQIREIDELVSPLLKKGQSPSHIHYHYKDQLMISLSTFYALIHSGLLSARRLDCPRIVRFKPRRKPTNLKIDKRCRVGRSYQDYVNFCQNHPNSALVEMDSTIGVQGGKVLLTVNLTEFDLVLAFIRDRNDAASITRIFDELKVKLGPEVFCQLFSVILTDNGSEVSNPEAIEQQLTDQLFCKLFYCDPGMPQQKPKIENMNALIRHILPKGCSFNDLTQQDMDLMVSHLNSYSRKKLNNLSPYKLFSSIFDSKILELLNIREIDPTSINLSPSLLHK